MKSELTKFLVRISREKLTGKSTARVTALMRIVNEIESIADCCYDLIQIIQRETICINHILISMEMVYVTQAKENV